VGDTEVEEETGRSSALEGCPIGWIVRWMRVEKSTVSETADS
jgi:hypothetical protein